MVPFTISYYWTNGLLYLKVHVHTPLPIHIHVYIKPGGVPDKPMHIPC